MIAKEKLFVETTDPRLKAGDAAEKQMAFYLKRLFVEVEGVRVFNDLRLTRNGDVAQIDHLILHRHGMIIIESKSVTTTIRINAQHEFDRKSGGKWGGSGGEWGGMNSPIEQARRQGKLMRALLDDHKRELREKKLFGLKQGTFEPMPIDIRVAISDQGMIQGSRTGVPEIMKADQVAGEAMKIIDQHSKATKFLTSDDETLGRYTLTPREFDRITTFLLAQHTPSPRQYTPLSREKTPPKQRGSKSIPRPAASHDEAKERHAQNKRGGEIWRERREQGRLKRIAAESDAPSKKTPQPASRARPLPAYLCTHCQSTNLAIRYGHSYYFKCADCEGNTPIKNVCSNCGANATTAKQGTTFSATCKACETSAVFFINPS